MLLQEMKEERVARGLVSTATEVGQVLLPNKYFSLRALSRFE